MSNFPAETHGDYVPSSEKSQRTPYYFRGQHSSIEKSVSHQLGPVAVHWFAEVANPQDGQAALNETAAEVRLTQRLQNYDKHMDAVSEAMRDDPDGVEAFHAKIRARIYEGDLPPDGPVEYDPQRPEYRSDADIQAAIDSIQATTQQIEQGEQ